MKADEEELRQMNEQEQEEQEDEEDEQELFEFGDDEYEDAE